MNKENLPGHRQLEAAYIKYHDQIYKKIYNKVLHKEIAEDLTSQVFVKVVKSYNMYDESKSSIVTWINHIATNTIIDYYRSHQKDMELLNVDDFEEILVVESDFFKKYEKKHRMKSVIKAIDKLKIQEKDLIYLKFFKCRTNREIACLYGLNESTVSTRLFRAMRKIRVCVNKE